MTRLKLRPNTNQRPIVEVHSDDEEDDYDRRTRYGVQPERAPLQGYLVRNLGRAFNPVTHSFFTENNVSALDFTGGADSLAFKRGWCSPSPRIWEPEIRTAGFGADRYEDMPMSFDEDWLLQRRGYPTSHGAGWQFDCSADLSEE